MSTQQTKCMSYTMLCETLSIRSRLAVADLEASLGVGAKKITHNLVVAEKSTQNNTEKHRHFQHTDLNVEVPVDLTLITDLQNDITLKTLAKTSNRRISARRLRPGCSSVPSMVNVFPEPVCIKLRWAMWHCVLPVRTQRCRRCNRQSRR